MFDSVPASIPAKTNTKLKTIIPIRCREALLGIPKKIEAVTDLRSLILAKRHDMCTEASRKEYVSCKIDGRVTRDCAKRQFRADLTNVEYARTVNTRYKQCNVYLCRKEKYWERYHNSKKF
jgi:hypothetical protein